LLGLLGALAMAPRSAQAQEFDLGVGADYWTEGGGIGLFTFGLDALWRVAPGFQLGLKPGFLLTNSSGAQAGIPLDFKMRLSVGRVYVDGFAGPWFFFSGNAVGPTSGWAPAFASAGSWWGAKCPTSAPVRRSGGGSPSSFDVAHSGEAAP
jgi:hypothetical protein